MKDLKIKHRWIWLFIIISSIATALIIKNIPPRMFIQGIKSIRPLGFLGAMVAVFMMWTADAIRLKVLGKATGSHMGMGAALRLVWGGLLFSGITPFEFGGGAYQILWMHRNGLHHAKGTAVITVKALLAMVVLLIMTPIVSYFYPDSLPSSALRYIMFVTCSLMFTSTAIMIISGSRPDLIVNTGRTIMAILLKLHLMRPNTSLRLSHAWSRWVNRCHSSFVAIFKKGNGIYLITATFYTILFLLAQFSVAPLLLIGAGVHIDIWKLILLQVPLTVLLYFIPTPGSTGVAEGGFYTIFAVYAPASLLGVLTLMWRFFTFYLGMMLGLISMPIKAE